MKSILLFRHGKSEWNTYYDSDHNRPLAPRGIKAAKKMGVFLANKNQMPDLVISSTAVRSRTTVELAMKEGRHIKWLNPVLNVQKKHDILKLRV